MNEAHERAGSVRRAQDAEPAPAGAAARTGSDARVDPKRIVREGYDRVSHAYRGDSYVLEPRSGYGHWLRRLERLLAPHSRVLDLGCGNGVPVVRELVKRHAVTGVDLSPVQIARARRLVPEARFVCADMAEIAFEPASFDAVTAFFSIIHLPVDEQPGLVGRVATWLAPGGVFLALLGRCAWTGTEDHWQGVEGATMYWSHADVAAARTWFACAGLEVVEEGTQPEKGAPGFAVLIARRASGGA